MRQIKNLWMPITDRKCPSELLPLVHQVLGQGHAGKADCFVPVTAITREFVLVTVRSQRGEGGTFRHIPS